MRQPTGRIFESVSWQVSIHDFRDVAKISIREISESVGMRTGETSREQKNTTEGHETDRMTFYSGKT